MLTECFELPPNVAAIRVSYHVVGGTIKPGYRDHVDLPPGRSVPSIVECLNPRCHGGGLELGYRVREIIEAGETRREFEVECRGDVGPRRPKRKTFGDPRYKRGPNVWTILVEITYT